MSIHFEVLQSHEQIMARIRAAFEEPCDELVELEPFSDECEEVPEWVTERAVKIARRRR